jgi:hypothetical protein
VAACGAKTGLPPAKRDSAGTVDEGGAGLTGRGGVAGAGGVAIAAVSGAGAGMGGAGLAGVGGVGSVAAGLACTPIAISDRLVNDFENGNHNFTSPSGIPQNWYQSTIVGEDWTLVFAAPNPPRPSSSSTLAIKLQGLGTHGAIGVLYNGCYAVPLARGIRFFVQAPSSPSPLVVRADTRATSPVKSGGTCDDCSHNIALVTLVSGWQEVEVPFERFTGGTYQFDANDQLGFSFQWSAGDQGPIPYELWIDDVTYVL